MNQDNNNSNKDTKAEKKSLPCPNQRKKPVASNDEFKRRYFDFYDDIKISDRQDW